MRLPVPTRANKTDRRLLPETVTHGVLEDKSGCLLLEPRWKRSPREEVVLFTIYFTIILPKRTKLGAFLPAGLLPKGTVVLPRNVVAGDGCSIRRLNGNPRGSATGVACEEYERSQ